MSTSKSPSRDYKKVEASATQCWWRIALALRQKKEQEHQSRDSASRIQVSTVSDVERCQEKKSNQAELDCFKTTTHLQMQRVVPSLNSEASTFSIHVSPTSEKKSDTRADVIVCPSLSLKNAAVHVYNDFSSQVRADEAEWHRRTDVSFAPLLSVFTLNVLSQVRDEVEWQRS